MGDTCVEVMNARIDDGRESADTLLDNMSLLSCESSFRPSSSSSFSSSYISTGSKSSASKIPVRPKITTSSTLSQKKTKDDKYVRMNKDSNTTGLLNKEKTIEISDIQKTLGRGEFVEGIMCLGEHPCLF